MKGNCIKCKAKESHAWKNIVSEHQKFELCADCSHVSAKHIPLHIKKQQVSHEKDLIQPFKYDKQEKSMIPNKDFTRAYGEKKAQAFSETISSENTRRRKNVSLSQATRPATAG